MKKIILAIAILTTVIPACNNSSSDKKESNTVQPVVTGNDTTAKQSTSTPTDHLGTISLKGILDCYREMKNAFVKDDDATAAAAANKMYKEAFADFNKNALTPDQLKIFNDIADDAKEHAEHIGSNAGNIKHQREHFDMLSKDIYQLVKAFGGGQKLYYDHCPMYNDGKGANWISETKEIANPYLGKSMPTCGTVKEELK